MATAQLDAQLDVEPNLLAPSIVYGDTGPLVGEIEIHSGTLTRWP